MSRNQFLTLTAACALAAGTIVPAGAVTPASHPPVSRAASSHHDIAARLRSLRGFTVQEVTEDVPAGFRYFWLTVVQPVDHDNPAKGTFKQRVALLHRDVTRPTVFFTSGYNASMAPSRSEPTRIVDGNEVSVEHRFFTPSRPKGAEWRSQLTIKQAAADQHRIHLALKQIYSKRWISTGGSKGGMTATYYRYFYPHDMAGTVPYVAPNDVVNDRDAYNDFLSHVGTPTCRADLVAVQRRILGKDRAWYVRKYRNAAAKMGRTFRLVGSVDRALEASVVDANFAFWQYQPQTVCGQVPDASTGTREEIMEWLEEGNPVFTLTDEGIQDYTPYFYQATHQLGWAEPYEEPLRDLLRYPGVDQPASFLPKSLKAGPFDNSSMAAVDRWVRKDATNMLFLYGSLDPWSAEPFTCEDDASAKRRDCSVYTVEGGNHRSTIAQLPEPARSEARARIRSWVGLSPAPQGRTASSSVTASLDQPMIQRRPAGM